ncbi:MAG: hypothetical protein ACTSU2_10745 [Promethearchaeota archaeon]
MAKKNIEFIIPSDRGSKLLRSNLKDLKISLKFLKDDHKIIPLDNQEVLQNIEENVILIIGNQINFLQFFKGSFQFNSSSNELIKRLNQHTEFMAINLSKYTLVLSIYLDNLDNLNTFDNLEENEGALKEKPYIEIYDPYLYENEKHVNIDPDKFREEYTVPDGYIDVLPKWYSIKFTYPDINYIFIRPKLGISIQKHNMREEHWEIGRGTPIIIVGTNVYYNTKVGEKFDIPVNSLHTVINPTDEWVLIKERYSGKFDEEDIVRVFNPNHYFSNIQK